MEPQWNPKRDLKAHEASLANDRLTLKWTTRAIEALKVAKRTDFTDPDTKGLALRVTPTGAKSWALLYRRKGDAKKRRLTLGEFPALGLADARAMAEAKKVMIRAGTDPAGLVSDYKIADTLGQLLDLFLEKHQRPDAVWTRECKRIFNKDVRPLIGSIKLPDLNRGHIRHVIEAVRDRGATVTVNRTLAALRRALSWGVSKDLLPINPALNMGTDIEETGKDRALSVDEIKAFWEGLHDAPMGERSRLILKIILATAQRPGEVCGATKAELNLENGSWLIPSKRTKNKEAHFVPLSKLAAKLFKQALSLSGDSDFIFSSRPRKGRALGLTAAIQVNALSHAMRLSLKELGLKAKPATPHDLRRTAATHMARLGIPNHNVGRVLNHGTEMRRTITSRVYIHYDYANEKKLALESWASELSRIVGLGASPSNVVKIKARQ